MGNSAIIATTKSARAIRVREHYRSITGQKPIVFFGFFRVISGNVDPEVAEVRWVSVAGLALAKLPTTSEEDCSQMQPELYSHFKISGNCWESPRYQHHRATTSSHHHITTSPHHHTTSLSLHHHVTTRILCLLRVWHGIVGAHVDKIDLYKLNLHMW